MPGVPSLIADLIEHVPPPAFAWVGEPTAMRVATAHKGVCVFDTRFTGKSAHSSLPALGHSAVADAVRFAAFLLETGVQASQRSTRVVGLDPPHTTFNLGQFNGGNALNTIACECALAWEFRPIPEDDVMELKARIRNFLCAHATGVSLPRGGESPPVGNPRPGAATHREVVYVPPLRAEGTELARAALSALLGRDEPETVVPFGTEAGLFQLSGIAAVVCGPGSIEQAHQPDEWIERAQLEQCAEALQRLPAHLAGRR